MVGVLIRMKLAIIRHSMTGGKAAWMVTGGAFGLLFAAATIWLTFVDIAEPGVLGDLLACVWAMWMLGWVVGPLWGGSAVLRADHFALLPVPRRKLALGLLGAAFVGVTTAVTALAFLSLITYAAHLGALPALIAVPAAAGELVFVVLLSRVAYALVGFVATSRIGAAVTGVLFAAMIVLSQSGWMIIVAIMYSDVLTTGFSATFSTTLRWIPSSWGVVAVDAAARGDWLLVLGALASLAVVIGLLLLIWAATLGTPRRSRVTIRGTSHAPVPTGGLFAGPTGTVFRKELRTWWRDPLRTTTATVPIAWALLTTLLPLTFDAKALLPWAGPAVALFAITSACNLYSQDGTALWQTITTGAQHADVRGRQLAYLTVFGPISIALSIGFTIWSGYAWAWPWVAATVPALLGGGAGLIIYASVVAMVPGPDAHKRPDNPLERADTTGQSNVLFWIGLLPAAPALTAVILGDRLDLPVLLWAGGPISLATGIALAWWLGAAAGKKLTATGADMLHIMRTGRNTATGRAATGGVKLEVSKRDATIGILYWIGGPILLFPQGIVPFVFILVGVDVKSWFLAMYVPHAWGLAVAGAGILIGIFLCAQAVRITFRNKAIRAQREAAAARERAEAGGGDLDHELEPV
ncbi:ABC-2 type transport system permease protein [Hamadaea flava]|uniref:ABC-2 type transport system permease protein n=1 Tax=Hamadaea flava TaxID=1742688 RepID=A0ABV8LFL5_9ACTN|nr:hypothetical protein [Hamadaea flava]MCP2329461.1 ABC-2 type transport system permease protein [Hamadaea flava]